MTSVSDFLYMLVILPVESIIESVFYFLRYFFPWLGAVGATAGVSFAVNFLTLPIYNIADAQQLKERELQKRLSGWVSKIRKAFKGDERFMMLSYYYKINHYHPAYALRETASILVQVPFFIAAYHFLSNCADLEGAAFGPIRNLGSPDALLHIGGMTLNLLPILMTVINLISGVIYTRGAPLREKLQSPILALLFLFLLYKSPSGLVLYWTLNNLFSLAKNAVKSFCPKPWLAVEVFICMVCIGLVWSVWFVMHVHISTVKIITVLSMTLVLPVGRILLARVSKLTLVTENSKPLQTAFMASCLATALLIGLALPASMISTSPTEFAFLGNTNSPLAYIWSSLTFGLGLCVLWPMAIYFMADAKHRPLISMAVILLAAMMLLNAFVFKHNYGTVFVTGEVEMWPILRGPGLFLSLGPVLALALLLVFIVFLLHIRKCGWLQRLMAAVALALLLYGTVKSVGISSVYTSYRDNRDALPVAAENGEMPLQPVFHLSKTGKNVFVFFLDKSVGLLVPYIMEQFPRLCEVYSGFTLYPNTLSFSNATLEGFPAIYGGYEYRPEEINKRDGELLNKKTNEAQLVLPRIFTEAGWDVTITDSLYTSYGNMISKDFLAECPGVKQIFTVGKYSSRYLLEYGLIGKGLDELAKTGMVRFFLMQVLYPPLRYFWYSGGFSYTNSAVPHSFIDDYSTLYYLPKLTDCDAEKNTYSIFYNLTAHDITKLAGPDYHPDVASKLNEFQMDTPLPDIYKPAGAFYECNAAAFLQIGKWLDYLKQIGVYDNTRIIIVGDHGFSNISHLNESFSENSDYNWFHTILMEKDFNADGEFKLDGSFMTNADAAYMSLAGLGLSLTNPYTGKEISSGRDVKTGGINIFACLNSNPDSRVNDTQYPIDINRGYHVSDDIYKESNWIPFAEWVKTHPEDMPAGVINGGSK